MITRTTQAFQDNVLKHLSFTPYSMGHYTLYKNTNHAHLGYFMKYTREGYYDFEMGDYTVGSDFSICFQHEEELLRFGTVYRGETSFEIEDLPISSFTPSSFFVIEKGRRGRQEWKKGTHLHGAEITIRKKYLDEIVNRYFPNAFHLDGFIPNHTYHYLPLEIASIIQNLRSLAETGRLTPLYLESKILEALALLNNEMCSSAENTFTNQFHYAPIKIGENRYITLTTSDIHALQKAYDILTKEACNPPTIKSLSKRVFLNEQKLKAGFSAQYHMSISEYTHSIRMTMAENLLATTELSIQEIAKKMGYHHSSNFVKAFKKSHGKTPLAFRKNKET